MNKSPNKILYFIILSLACSLAAAQEITPTSDGGIWGISFYSNIDTHEGLYWISADGGEPKSLVKFDDLLKFDANALGIQYWAALTSKGDKLAFSFLYGIDIGDGAIHDPESGDLYVYDLANQELQQITQRAQDNGYPEYFAGDWNPAGTQLAYFSTGSSKSPLFLNIYDLNTGTAQLVFDANIIKDADPVTLFDVAWSPDGQQLAAVIQVSNFAENQSRSSYQIYWIDLKNSTAHQILSESNQSYAVSWSSDQQFLYYGCKIKKFSGICRVNVVTLEVQEILSLAEDGIERYPGYIDVGAGGQLVFTNTSRSTIGTYLTIYDPSTDSLKQLFRNDNSVVNPHWFYCSSCN